MFYIVETKEQLDKLPQVSKCFIDLIAKSEDAHPLLTTPSAIYYNDFEKGYILVIDHSEGFSLSLEDVQSFLDEREQIYLIDAKYHSYFLNLPQHVDLRFWVKASTDLDCYTTVHKDFYHRHRYNNNINTLIPISKHYEKSECMFDLFKEFVGWKANTEWQRKFTEVYKWVEEQGLSINEKLFDKHYEPTWKANSVRNGKIYTSYNLYNITSRPTNAYNGLNFLALPKDKSRQAFVPSNDRFIELDFDGYHVRLIANLLGVEIPENESIHIHLGRQYYGKQELTEEEYQDSKKHTFRQLYNGVEDDYKSIDLFAQVDEFVHAMWQQYKDTGYLELPNGSVLASGISNSQKLFNYYIQCLETVNNVKKLAKLKEALQGKKTKVVLVVYDSMLIDYAAEDGKETLKLIKDILEEDGYLVKAKLGDNYGFSE
jgi:hypothetical protein